MTPLQIAFHGLLGREVKLSPMEEGLSACLLVMAVVKLAEKSEKWASSQSKPEAGVEAALQTLEERGHTLGASHHARIRRLHDGGRERPRRRSSSHHRNNGDAGSGLDGLWPSSE